MEKGKAWHGPFLPPPCTVQRFQGKGNGLVADRQLAKGTIIFTEKPAFAWGSSNKPHCHHCFRSLVSTEQDWLSRLPRALELSVPLPSHSADVAGTHRHQAPAPWHQLN